MRTKSTRSSALHAFLLKNILGIVVLVFACFLLASYFAVARPTQKELASTVLAHASAQVESNVRNLFGNAQDSLATVQTWGRGGMLNFDDPNGFARLLIPVLKTSGQITVAIFADGQGRSMQVNHEREQQTGWVVHVADPIERGAMQRLLHYDDEGNFLREEQLDRLYDARTRPWHQVALAAAPGQVHWTDPYLFFARHVIGITATSRWTDSTTGGVRIVAYDLLLSDLSLFTSQLEVSRHGSAALLTADGKLLTAPRLPEDQASRNLEARLFVTPEQAGAMPLARAIEARRTMNNPDSFSGPYAVDGESWIAQIRPLRFNNLLLYIATFGPISDFILIAPWYVATVGLAIAAALVLAFLVARRLSNRFARTVDHLVAESERIGNLQLDRPVQLSTSIREIDKLVKAQERMRIMLQERAQEIQKTQDATIMALASLAEARDNETGNHIRRTQHYVRLLAEQLQSHPRFAGYLTKETISLLFKSAPLHDIGKVGIPDAILLKPGKLTPAEFDIMKTHTTLGGDAIAKAEILMDASSSFLRYAGEIAYAHQEKWDGSGYPKGLAGDEIPVSARLMALADVYDALISRRVYKPAFSHEKAVGIIQNGRGTHFDPDIVDAFMAIHESFRQIAGQFADGEEEPISTGHEPTAIIEGI